VRKGVETPYKPGYNGRNLSEQGYSRYSQVIPVIPILSRMWRFNAGFTEGLRREGGSENRNNSE